MSLINLFIIPDQGDVGKLDWLKRSEFTDVTLVRDDEQVDVVHMLVLTVELFVRQTTEFHGKFSELGHF